MPQLGETVREGKIVTWFKAVGDPIKPGDNLFEVETDKVTVEVPATGAGIISDIRVDAGDVAKVGVVVAVISPAGTALVQRAKGEPSKAAAAAPVAKASAPAAPPAQAAQPAQPINLNPWREVNTPERNYGPATLANGARITPLARRLASEAGLDVASLKGSGPHGRVTARDIDTAKTQQVTRAPAQTTALDSGLTLDQVKALYRETPFEEVPLDGMRRVIATRLVQAKQTVPHFYVTMDVEMERLIRLREEVNAAAPKDGPGAFKLSVNDFVIKALAIALQRVPAANAVWAQDRILRFGQSDVAVAVSVEGGLFTPVIRKAEQKSLSAISREMRDLAARARDKALKPEEYQGGSTAVSNLGMHGVREFAAIINPPHATILAVGAAQRRPTEAADGSVRFVSQMTATLSCDHRVVDGALGAELLGAFKALIENPVMMVV